MSITSTARADWKGALKDGSGHVTFGSFAGDYTFAGRFETGSGTNPEELLAAAHASCFSMQLSGLLTANGTPPTSIHTTVSVTIQAGTGITKSLVETEAVVPGIDPAKFEEIATKAKEICPVSRALAGIPDVTLNARLKG